MVDDRAFLIRPKLFAALKELRSHFQDGHAAQVAIWIDAICITKKMQRRKPSRFAKCIASSRERKKCWCNFTHGVCVPWKIVVDHRDILLNALMYTGTLNERMPVSRTKELPPFVVRKESVIGWEQSRFLLRPSAGSHISVLLSLMQTKRPVSTIAKDKVFGLMALWHGKIHAEIVLDYTRGTAQVFANAVKTGLKMDKRLEERLTIADVWNNLDGFNRSPPSSATERFPSWCPDFQGSIGPQAEVHYKVLSLVVTDRVKSLAYYEHTPGFETVSIQVLKLDTVSQRMEAACPSASHDNITG